MTESMKALFDEFMAINNGDVSEEPRTIEGEFPGSKTRAMGHARYAKEKFEGAGLDVEMEYIGECDYDFDAHRIDLHVNGGSDGS